MSFSKEWETCYKANTQMSIWPWSDLVSYVYRYAKPIETDFKVLELGCGAGANIPFFKHLNINYYAIEGSETIVNMLQEKFPEYKNSILVGDFTKEIPFNEQFDLIIDRAAITHNTTSNITKTLSLVHSKLKTNGKFIGIDWFSTNHSDYAHGVSVEDKYTKTNAQKGQFVGVGNVHFADRAHLFDLFSDFEIEILEHKISKKEIPKDNHIFASWNCVAIKK